MPPLRGRGERFTCTVFSPETRRWKEGLIKSKWSHINERIEIRMLMTVKSDTEQRNLVSISYTIPANVENMVRS